MAADAGAGFGLRFDGLQKGRPVDPNPEIDAAVPEKPVNGVEIGAVQRLAAPFS